MRKLYRTSLALVAGIHIVSPFLDGLPAQPLALVSLLLLVTGFSRQSRAFQRASVFFLLAALLLLIKGRIPASVWMAGLGSMTNIVAIVTVMQAFSVPIRIGAYDQALRAWLDSAAKNDSRLFALVTLSTHVLTALLNLGSIPVIVGLFEKTLQGRREDWRRFFSRSAVRGYVMTALWSPGAVNLSLVAQATGLPWSRLFLPGLALAALALALSLGLELLGASPRNEGSVGAESAARAALTAAEAATPPESVPVSRPTSPQEPTTLLAAPQAGTSSILAIPLVLACFIALIKLLEALGLGTSSGRLILAGLTAAAGWTLALHRRTGKTAALWTYWRQDLPKAGEIAPFFIVMGLFSEALEASGVLGGVVPILAQAGSSFGPLILVPAALLIVAASLFGIHPFLGIIVVGKILHSADIMLSPLSIALSLSVGAAAAYLVTPFAGVIMTFSRSIGATALDVALRWNWLYALLFFAAGMGFALLLS